MFCENCGKEIEAGSVFCTNCGARVEGSTVTYDTTVLNDEPQTEVLGVNEPAQIYEAPAVPTMQQQTYAPPAQPQPNAYGNPNYYQPPNAQAPAQPIQQPVSPSFTDGGRKLTYIEFFKQFASKKTKNYSTTIGVICFLTCALCLAAFGMTNNYWSVVDILFYLVFGIINLKTRKWWAPLAVTIYSGIFTIIGLFTEFSLSGVGALIIGILATIALKKIDDAYTAYYVNGTVPQNQI